MSLHIEVKYLKRFFIPDFIFEAFGPPQHGPKTPILGLCKKWHVQRHSLSLLWQLKPGFDVKFKRGALLNTFEHKKVSGQNMSAQEASFNVARDRFKPVAENG